MIVPVDILESAHRLIIDRIVEHKRQSLFTYQRPLDRHRIMHSLAGQTQLSPIEVPSGLWHHDDLV